MRALRFSLLVASLLAAMGAPLSAQPPQSPITFANFANRNLGVPVFTYPDNPNPDVKMELSWTKAEAGNKGKPESKKIEGKIVAAGMPPVLPVAKLDYRGETYRLEEFHFHAPEEHVLGNNYPLELHLVHKNVVTGRPLAVGLWIEETPSMGQENAALALLANDLPAGPAAATAPNAAPISKLFKEFMLTDLLPPDPSNYFRYNGSLTTFKKNIEKDRNRSGTAVQWLFFKDPLILTLANINKLAGNTAMTEAHPAFAMNPNTHRLTMHMHVPEPSTVWLLAVVGLVVAGRRGDGRASASSLPSRLYPKCGPASACRTRENSKSRSFAAIAWTRAATIAARCL